MSEHAQQQLRLGFLSAIGGLEQGFVAGILVTNQFGRPLEFQCTTAVKPNQTQVILYGPTLVPFVLGEVMGRTLIERVSLKPQLIVTDRDEILELRNHISIPVVCLATESSETIIIGRQVFRVHPTHPSDRNQVKEIAGSFTKDADLAEPLERVCTALKETLAPGVAA